MESQAVIIPIFGMGQKVFDCFGRDLWEKFDFDSEVDVLSAELLDEGSVVLEPVQAANNKRLAAAVSVNRIFFILSFLPVFLMIIITK